MAKNYMDRINALRERFLNTRVELDVYHAKYMTDGFKETEGQPWCIQKATGYYNQCANKNVFIEDNELLVGGIGYQPRCGIVCPDTLASILEEELDTMHERPFDPFFIREECKEIYRSEVKDYWKNKSFRDMWFIHAPEDMKRLRDSGMIYIDRKAIRGFGETTPGWEYLLQTGLGGIKKKAEEALAQLDDARVGDLDKMFFYKSEIMACDAVILLANRHADLAEKMAAECEDETRKAELLKIAEVCRWVPENPARNFYEACQFMLFYEYAICMEQMAASYNLGRIDQYLYPYYKADKEAGILTDEGAQELLDCLWIKINEMSLFADKVTAQYAAGYIVTVQASCGGIDKYGNDATNELSYMMIQATMDVHFKEPNMTVRYNMAKNPDSLLRKAVEAFRTGLSMPAIYHDDAGIRMMMNKGVPLSEAWDWVPCGCVETTLAGKQKQYTDMADLSMAAVMEMVLNNGVSRKTGKQASIQTGDPRDFKTFDEFYGAIKKQIDYFVDCIASGCQLLDYLGERFRPSPVLSLGFPDCLDKGLDYSRGGAKYNVGNGVIAVGQADIINSLAAVKQLVYDEKKITMDELLKALDANFEGYEDIHEMCMAAPKYGNDDERADFIVGDLYTYVVDKFEEYDTANGKMTTGMLPVSGNTPLGEWIGALPSGRKAGTPLTDGIGATGGTDVNGPTALLKSVSRIPHTRYTQGTQLNLKLEPSLLEGETGLVAGMNLIKTMCTLGIYHAQFNVVNQETLIDAQEHPEDHKDLLIRVAGYTAFFVELGREVQDEIIGRTVINSI